MSEAAEALRPQRAAGGRLAGRVAFVTGAARGQGRSHCLMCAEEGADVIAIDVCEQLASVDYELGSEQDLAETAAAVGDLGRRIVARKADVRDAGALARVLGEGVAELGRLDVVCANAGITGTGAVDELSELAWEEMIDVNQTGVWNTCRAAIPHIRAGGRGGSIVITSSTAGLHAMPNVAHYVAAKHGIVGLMRGLAIELGPDRIRVNSVHPTQTRTPMLANESMYRLFCPDLEQPTLEDLAPVSETMHVLPEPWIEAADVSNAVLFLASDEARFVTGATLAVDCGADLIA